MEPKGSFFLKSELHKLQLKVKFIMNSNISHKI